MNNSQSVERIERLFLDGLTPAKQISVADLSKRQDELLLSIDDLKRDLRRLKEQYKALSLVRHMFGI